MTVSSRIRNPLKTMAHKTETDAMHWLLLTAFMERACSVMQDGGNVTVAFHTDLEAEEFRRFILGGRELER